MSRISFNPITGIHRSAITRLIIVGGILFATGTLSIGTDWALTPVPGLNCTITVPKGGSINAVLALAGPGSVVCLGDGFYEENVKFSRSGTPSAWITLAAVHKHAAIVLSVNVAKQNYIEIDNVHVTGGRKRGIYTEGGHHTRVFGNLVENMPGGGINLDLGDYRTIIGNTVRNCSKGTRGNTSGISIWDPAAFDTATGYHNTISYNTVYNNANPVGGTDGNGIIFDDANNTQSNTATMVQNVPRLLRRAISSLAPVRAPVYLGGALIEENLAYANGGAGIKVYESQNALVRNNTVYWNHNFKSNSFDWRGEIDNERSSHNIFVNNIMVANTRFNSSNTAICECDSKSDVWKYNITYNGVPGKASVNGSPISPTRNFLGVDPMLINPPADFRLSAGSPAERKGTIAYGVPATNFAGTLIPVSGPVDIGAF